MGDWFGPALRDMLGARGRGAIGDVLGRRAVTRGALTAEEVETVVGAACAAGGPQSSAQLAAVVAAVGRMAVDAAVFEMIMDGRVGAFIGPDGRLTVARLRRTGAGR